ncbi:MAG: plasmid mobilization relaxosome protein MobC [Pseudomonadota bacterium]
MKTLPVFTDYRIRAEVFQSIFSKTVIFQQDIDDWHFRFCPKSEVERSDLRLKKNGRFVVRTYWPVMFLVPKNPPKGGLAKGYRALLKPLAGLGDFTSPPAPNHGQTDCRLNQPGAFPWTKFKSLPVLLKNMGQPYAVWMCATVSMVDHEDGFRPFHDDRGTAPEQKERMARPTKDQHEKRNQRFNLRFTLAEIEHVRSQAQAAGLEPHEYLRRRALGHAVAPAPSSSSDPAIVSELNRIGVNVNQLARATHRGSDFTRYWMHIAGELRTTLEKVMAGHDS